jgi:hypothetical protein
MSSTPTKYAQNRWQTIPVVGAPDYLQLIDAASGLIVGWIDSFGIRQGSLAGGGSGGGGLNFQNPIDLIGIVDGSNLTFTFPSTASANYIVTVGGVILTPIVDYTVTAGTVLFADAPLSTPIAYEATTNPSGGFTAPTTILALAPSAPGNFTVPHGLGTTPVAFNMQMTSGGTIYWQVLTWDATNVYLVASDVNVTANLLLWS